MNASCDVTKGSEKSGGSRCFCGCPIRGILPAAILFTLLVQGLTGFCLKLYYSASAQTAWESVYYIQYQVAGGWLLRGVHHWAAQLLLIFLLAYVAQLVFSGVYRLGRGRTLTYLVVVFLILCCLATMLTGDLLSWDQNSIAATKARVSYLNLLPLIGPPLYRLALGGSEMGTLTLTRFYTLHTVCFGSAMMGLGALLVASMVPWDMAEIRKRFGLTALFWGATWLVVAIVLVALVYHGDGPLGTGVALGSPGDLNPLNA